MTFLWGGLRVSTHDLAPDDKWVLMNKGKVVAIVPRGAPIEDAICDELVLPRSDFELVKSKCS